MPCIIVNKLIIIVNMNVDYLLINFYETKHYFYLTSFKLRGINLFKSFIIKKLIFLRETQWNVKKRKT